MKINKWIRRRRIENRALSSSYAFRDFIGVVDCWTKFIADVLVDEINGYIALPWVIEVLDEAFRRAPARKVGLYEKFEGETASSYLVQVPLARGSLTPVIASTTEDFPICRDAQVRIL